MFIKKKGPHSIIHHFIGFQPDYPKRNVISSPPTTCRRLTLNYGAEHCLSVCVRNRAQQDAQDSYLKWCLVLLRPCHSSLYSLSLWLRCGVSQQTLQVQFWYKQHSLQDGEFSWQPRNNDSQSGVTAAPVSLHPRVAVFEDIFDCYS